MQKAKISMSLSKFDVDGVQNQAREEHEMRVLTEKEILSVAGGPESDVGTGG